MQSMGSLERVNRISPKDHQRKEKEWKGKKVWKRKEGCERKAMQPFGKQRTDGANQISEEPEEDYYAFLVKCDSDLSGVADLYIGGVQVNNVLIDSGATCNIVDLDTWKSLKQECVKCRSQRCERKQFAYGQTEPIEVLGTFESGVYFEASGVRCVAEFTVVKSHGRALLGKDTAEKLNVLRVGPPNSPQKLAGKMYADKRRHAVDNPIAPGDKVLIKNSKSTGKLTPNFETEPYTAQAKEGQELTLKSAEDVAHQRNSSFVKPYNTPEEPENPGRAEALTNPVISPLSVTTSETTEKTKPNYKDAS
ncbi:hypothetical protein P5673_024475 [Acropora cervicornis]|uniref:Uncharacterized protein n=1 Tax=Acropora cervicornis TaxID=6130 RepID=A0AAD9Q3M1_ACRCE|nr:hypothetical protein P5673_024475 [Acropora cervicornis]